MYWSWQIAKEGYRRTKDPEPPSFPGCDIDWFWKNPGPEDVNDTADLNNVPAYVGAAMDMVRDFHLIKNPGLTSKLAEGKAISFILSDVGKGYGSFYGPKTLKGIDNKFYIIEKNGHIPGLFDNKNLQAFLESFKVFIARDTDLDYFYAVYTDDGKWN